MVNLAPLTQASKAGVPAFEQFLDDTVPWLTRLKPYLGDIVPVVDYINTYRREIAAFFANSTATTQATSQNITQTKLLHYLRISNPVNPEVLTGLSAPAVEQPRQPVLWRPAATTSCSPGFPRLEDICARARRSRRLVRRFRLTSPRPCATSTSRPTRAGRRARRNHHSARQPPGSHKLSPNSNHCHERGRLCF